MQCYISEGFRSPVSGKPAVVQPIVVKRDRSGDVHKGCVKIAGIYFKVVGELGKGGFSTVKEAINMKTNERVALKIAFLDGKRSAQRMIEYAEVEVKATHDLKHRNVNELIGWDLIPTKFENRDSICMIQKLASNGDLLGLLKNCGERFSEKLARCVGFQIVRGLLHCHKLGICHRDIKLENLLLDHKFELKLADFGLAFRFIRKSKSGKTAKFEMKGRVGTNGYMAPEIMTGKPYDAKCDVFSVAVVLFSMLAGFPPIQNQKEDGDAYWKKLSKSDFKGFWKWHERRFKFSKVAKNLLTGMLQPNPAKRLSMQEVFDHEFFKAGFLKLSEYKDEMKRLKEKADRELMVERLEFLKKQKMEMKKHQMVLKKHQMVLKKHQMKLKKLKQPKLKKQQKELKEQLHIELFVKIVNDKKKSTQI